jgi:hypothetical protein
LTPSRILRLACCAVLSLLAVLASAAPASAYPTMIRHGYTACMPCHTDPAGAGPLTPYGRAQGELLLATRYGAPSEEASRASGFLWGGLEPPEQLRLGGDVREAWLDARADRGPGTRRFLTMRADLYADVKLGRLRAEGSIGYAPRGAFGAALSGSPTDNVVSRDHWLGLELDDDGAWLLRAGRMALPFGVRSVEHTLWARALTRTDGNDAQQHGLALSLAKGPLRAEIMGIAGNLQVHPDDFRERGYIAFVELALAPNAAVGASSLFTRARRDLYARVTSYRQAHGVFARYSPVPSLVFLMEADLHHQSLTWNGHRAGYAGFLQGDWEPRQGIHLLLTGEAKNGGSAGEQASTGAWASVVWFFLPHADVRLDEVVQRLDGASRDTTTYSLLAQLHAYL